MWDFQGFWLGPTISKSCCNILSGISRGKVKRPKNSRGFQEGMSSSPSFFWNSPFLKELAQTGLFLNTPLAPNKGDLANQDIDCACF